MAKLRTHGVRFLFVYGSTLLATLALALLSAAPSLAGSVTLGTSGWKAEWPDSWNGYLDVNLDNVIPGDKVIVQKSAEFFSPPELGVFPPAIITFKQISADAVPVIVINDEILTNSTGVDWRDFHMELIDMGDSWFDEALTNASAGGNGFNIEPFQQYDFAPAGPQPTSFNVWDGVIENGMSWYPGDGPADGDLFIQTTPHDGVNEPFLTFSLKEFPTVPEPASGALVCIGLVFLVMFRCRRAAVR